MTNERNKRQRQSDRGGYNALGNKTFKSRVTGDNVLHSLVLKCGMTPAAAHEMMKSHSGTLTRLMGRPMNSEEIAKKFLSICE